MNINSKYIKPANKTMFKSFVQVKRKKRTFAPLLFGPADLGNIIMFCQVVQVAIEILQTSETNEIN